MPRKIHVPKYPEKPHKTGQARIRLPGRGDVYLGVWGSEASRAEYSRVIGEWLSNRGAPARPDGASVAYIVSRFLTHAEQHYSPTGGELTQFRLSVRELLTMHATLPACEFRARHLEAVRNRMAETLCRRVTNRRMVRIRSIWRWAERQELVPDGSYEHLRTLPWLRENDRLARNTPDVQPTDWRDLLAVCRCAVPAVRAMLLLSWWSGARSCELRAMRNGDVDASGDVWVYRPRTHKNKHRGKDRAILLGVKCQALLRAWLRADDPDGFVFRPLRCRRNTRGLQQFKSNGYTFNSFRNSVRQACIRAGVKILPHGNRHAARIRTTRAFSLDESRAFLGHTSVETTGRYAAGQDLETAKKVARKLG